MIVDRSSFLEVVTSFEKTDIYALDTETTGLKWYGNHRLFSLILADEKDGYYFNFNNQEDHLGNKPDDSLILPREWILHFKKAFENPDSLWFLHNAKFDMGMLAREGLSLTGTVHCTEAMARLVDNRHSSYSLDSCLKRMQAKLKKETDQKLDVKTYLNKHKLFEDIYVRGKGKPVRENHFHKLPFDLVAPYGAADGIATRSLGIYQIQTLKKVAASIPKIYDVIKSERQLTKTLHEMEKAGFPIDTQYTDQCLTEELAAAQRAKDEFRALSGVDYVDSRAVFKPVFDRLDLEYPQTEKGNPSFSKDALAEIDNPLANIITEIRWLEKRCSSYYSSFQYFQHKGMIHAQAFQSGAATGRMSYRDPSMQNIPKPDEDKVDSEKVRKCFKPKPDCVLFMPDYDQMEYRMMLDVANEAKIIDLINNEGLDVHTATADQMGNGVTRKQAKTINFMLLYGGGAQKLATALGIALEDAVDIKKLYFEKLPNVKVWSNDLQRKALRKGHIINWFGRVVYIDHGFSYKAPNYYIQGGCADVCKIAMNRIAEFLKPYKTEMALQVHDELIFHLHKDELDLAPKIVEIMEKAYPYHRLPLTAGPSFSTKSWGEKQDGYPGVGDVSQSTYEAQTLVSGQDPFYS